MESFDFLLFLAIILISTKVCGLFTRKINMPQVVGALVAGVILGPSVLNLIQMESDGNFLAYMAEIGVILLMFCAGLETDLTELKENGVASFVVAVCGVLLPLLGGFVSYALYFHVDVSDFRECMKAVFVGVVLTATSVSITVETLRELGHLKGKVGATILGAAIIDDILGIIVLTVVTSLEDTSVNPATVLGKIALYFVVIGVLWFILSKAKGWIEKKDHLRRTAILSLAFCFLMAYASEQFFGIADITGAYFAGLMLCSMKIENYVERRVSIPSYLIFSPVFFASIGMKTNLDGLNGSLILFSLILLAIAILTKVLGCGLGAKLCKYTTKESLQIGVGMISRGEVALIVAQKGYQAGMLNDDLFAPIVLVVIVTTLITPILLGMVFKDKDENKKEVAA
ncbi:MAG: cation:proton antiporter [Lachnospiraceae bacterium]|nr:cation:proton antiporter [Lachnospiraceae bacterium]MDD7379511.1 cation:proton antiporter [Lachnospiraceae bacterium]MDY4616373.1 cation:proton antiporter [Lachnospiraceae bacterium]